MTRAVHTLPEDLQTLLFELFDACGRELPAELAVVRVPLRRFPVLGWDDLDGGDVRGRCHALAMVDAPDLPPVVVAGNQWLDGRHRVWAARHAAHADIPAFDLAPYGVHAPGWALLP